MLRYWDGEAWTEHSSVVTISPRGLPPAPPPSTRAGWYRDDFDPTRARFWDGKAWHLHTYPIGATTGASSPTRTGSASAPLPPAAPAPRVPRGAGAASDGASERALYRRGSFWIIAAGVLAALIVGLTVPSSKHSGSSGAASADVTHGSSGGDRTGASGTTPTTKPSTTSTTNSPADVAWRAQYWDQFVPKMQRDRFALRDGLDAAQFGRSSSLTLAGRQLQADVKTFGLFPAISNSQAQQQWQALLADLTKLADEAAGYDGSRATVTQASDDIAKTASEQQQITTIMGWT